MRTLLSRFAVGVKADAMERARQWPGPMVSARAEAAAQDAANKYGWKDIEVRCAKKRKAGTKEEILWRYEVWGRLDPDALRRRLEDFRAAPGADGSAESQLGGDTGVGAGAAFRQSQSTTTYLGGAGVADRQAGAERDAFDCDKASGSGPKAGG